MGGKLHGDGGKKMKARVMVCVNVKGWEILSPEFARSSIEKEVRCKIESG